MAKSRPLTDAPARNEPHRFLPALLALFICSGACALIYEVVWFQLLELVIGSSAISLGVLLATYMGGLCIGSLALPRFVSRRHPPLRVYAFLELGIGVCGLLVLLILPVVSGLWSVAGGAPGPIAILVRAVISAVCLLPPTILMGATLPAAARWLESTPRGVSWIGFLYGGNTIGAVIGSVLAGFYLLRVYNLMTATLVAVFANFAIGGLAYLLSGRTQAEAPPIAIEEQTALPNRGAWPVYVAIGISGLCALGAQVVWTRLLSLLIGGTVYTFAMIVAVFLAGLGIGSSVGSWIARSSTRPRLVLGWCQLLQTIAMAWAAVIIAKALPNWPINPSLAPSIWFAFQLDLTRCIWVVLPGALLWGASFPLALAGAAARGQDPARLVSGIYAANTVGAILGALGASLIFVPMLGTEKTQQFLVVLAAVSAVLLFISMLREAERAPEAETSPRTGPAMASLAVTLLLAVFSIAIIPPVPGLLVAYGRYTVTWLNQVDVEYVGEGMNSSVAVTTLKSSGARQFHVSGKVEASNFPQDMRLQRMLGHTPALIHPEPKSVLIVGFGAGVTAGSFVPYPTVNRIVICEIERLIPEVVSTYFRTENNNVLNDPRTQVFYDDARAFILTTDEKFDIITSDPIHPWVKGAASLYTKEYFEAVKAHLNPGGVVTQWVPLYESTVEAVKSEIATFFEVFPHGSIWANNKDGVGYDVVLLGTLEPTRIDLDVLRQRFSLAGFERVGASLAEVGFSSPLDLFSTFAGVAADLTPWTTGAVINRDRNLRLQYLAASGLNRYEAGSIFDEIAQYRRLPDGFFTGDPALVSMLRQAIGGMP